MPSTKKGTKKAAQQAFRHRQSQASGAQRQQLQAAQAKGPTTGFMVPVDPSKPNGPLRPATVAEILGAPTAVPSGSVGTPGAAPGAPGSPAPQPQMPVIEPFMTADDLLLFGQTMADFDKELQDIDFGLGELQANTDYELANLERDAQEARTDTNDDMAGRGIFMSSIRDGEIFDIDATAAIRKNLLDTQLKTAILNANNRRNLINTARENFQRAINQKMTDNAREASADLEVPTTDAAQTAPGAAQTPPGAGAPRTPGTAQTIPQIPAGGPLAAMRAGLGRRLGFAGQNTESGVGTLRPRTQPSAKSAAPKISGKKAKSTKPSTTRPW